jgi:arylsulfatase A-like enzyme/tetratricopeptide (TPR) repeat protein
MTRRATRPILLALVAGLAGSCTRSGEPRFPGAPVVLISIDTLRADHLPAYGYRAVETPHLDRFRRDAVLFERAYSHAPLTLPSHLSMLSGLLPFEHGVRDNLGYRFDTKAHPTLQGLLKAKGYATGGFVSAWVLRGGSGIGEGFDQYDDRIVAPLGSDALGRVQRPGALTAAIASQWLQGVKDKPFFLFFHVYEPHAPYEPPEPFKSRYPLAYDGEIAAADAIVGGLIEELRRLGIYDHAVIVVLSDHGEGLGEHGEDDHGILLYRWALHVPLLLKLPGSARAGTSVAAPVGLTDLMPTLLPLVGIPAPKGLRGRSLLDPAPAPRRIYAETCYPRIHLGWSDLRTLVDDRWQYVEGVKRELYDLPADPGEQADLVATQGEVVRSRQKELAELPAALTGPTEVSAADLENLAALGYLGGTTGATGPLPDPRERLPVLRDVKTAFRLATAGRDQEAVTVFRRVLEANPLLFDARYEMAQTLLRLGRLPEAYDAYKAALRTSPSLAGPVALDLGRVCLKLGRLDEAAANARVGLKSDAAQAHELLARIALARDDLDGAAAEAGLAGDPAAEMSASVVRAEIHLRRGQAAEALAVLDESLHQATGKGLAPVPDLHFLRGDALARLGRYPEAEAAFEEEIRLFPGNAPAYARLAIVYGIEHRAVKQVDRILERMVAASPKPETIELAAKTLESMGDPAGARTWRRRLRPSG